jgi:hypothetical protein
MSKPWFIFDSKPGKATASLLFDEKSLALLVGYGVLLLNSRIEIFPGTHNTSWELMVGVAPLLPVFLVAIAGFNLVRYSKSPAKGTLAAMAVAPLFLLVFAVSKAYDPASFFIAYRMLDFLDPFVGVAAGVGLAYLIAVAARRVGVRRETGPEAAESERSPKARAWRADATAFAIGASFVLLVASTTPLAYDWERVFDVSSETKPQQYSAIEWARGSGIVSVSSDHWNADIAGPYFEMDSDRMLPYHLRDGRGYGDKAMILEEEWRTRGPQTPLSGRLPIPTANFDAVVSQGDLVYSSGPAGDRVYVVVP